MTARPLTIAVDTLAVSDAQQGSRRMLQSLVAGLVRNRDDERFVLFVSAANQHLFAAVADSPHVDVHRVRLPGANPLARVVADQVSVPRRAGRHADVLLMPADVAALRCPVPQVVNLWSHLAVPRVRAAHPQAIDAGQRSRARDLYHRALLGRSLHRADAVVAISGWLAGEAERQWDVPVEGILLGADPPAHLPADPGPGARPSGPNDPILFVGSLYPYKNVRQLITAHGRLASAGGATGRRPVVVVGSDPDGRQAEDLRQRAATVGTGLVSVRTAVSDAELDELYGTAHCLVLTSYGEGFGLPVVEAMARGVPVIASDRMSLPEVAAGAALLVDPDDPAALAVALDRLDHEPGLRDDRVAAGRSRAAELTWDATARRYLEVLRAVARRPSATARAVGAQRDGVGSPRRRPRRSPPRGAWS